MKYDEYRRQLSFDNIGELPHPADRSISDAVAHTLEEAGIWQKGSPPHWGAWHTILFADGWAFDKVLFKSGIDRGARKVKFLPHFDKDGKSLPLCGHCGSPAHSSNDCLHWKPPPQVGLIETRETTHGPYNKTAAVAQSLKGNIRACTNWATLPAQQKEAIEMIMHKIARILEGKATHADHWDDIAGYAELGKRATYSD